MKSSQMPALLFGSALLIVIALFGVHHARENSAAALISESAARTIRVSIASDRTEGNLGSAYPDISDNGRYIAFASEANTLVTDDSNDDKDVFLHDSHTGQTRRVSVASNGTQGTEDSSRPAISGDGRYIAFDSYANNLVVGDFNDKGDVFLHDALTGKTTIVSVASDGTHGSSSSIGASISADGRYIAFSSHSKNLVPDDNNSSNDVFVHDTQTGKTIRVSLSSVGVEGNNYSSSARISANGRFVSFASEANNLVPDDSNSEIDIFLHDIETGNTSRVSVSSDGTQSNDMSLASDISADGRFVAFNSDAYNLVPDDPDNDSDVFLHDTQTGQTTLVSVKSDGTHIDGDCSGSTLSSDGNFVGFNTWAGNFIPGYSGIYSDAYIHNIQSGITSLVSVNSDGIKGNEYSSAPEISAHGRYVSFSSLANNLIADDSNDREDVFVHDRRPNSSYLPFIMR